jgi:hypothetical protein
MQKERARFLVRAMLLVQQILGCASGWAHGHVATLKAQYLAMQVKHRENHHLEAVLVS